MAAETISAGISSVMSKRLKTCPDRTGIGITNTIQTIPPGRITLIPTKLVINITVVACRPARAFNLMTYAVKGRVSGLTTQVCFFKIIWRIRWTFTCACLCIRHHVVRTSARRCLITCHITFGTTHAVTTFGITTIFIPALRRRRRRATCVRCRTIITAAIRTAIRSTRRLNYLTRVVATPFFPRT